MCFSFRTTGLHQQIYIYICYLCYLISLLHTHSENIQHSPKVYFLSQVKKRQWHLWQESIWDLEAVLKRIGWPEQKYVILCLQYSFWLIKPRTCLVPGLFCSLGAEWWVGRRAHRWWQCSNIEVVGCLVYSTIRIICICFFVVRMFLHIGRM